MENKKHGKMRVDAMEVFAVQQSIIELQSGAINKLFFQLMQYVTAEEVDNLDCIEDINQAAKLRAMIGDP